MPEPEATRVRALEQLASLLVAVERPYPVRVAIDGRTAAGKTTLADELVAPIARHRRPAIRIQIDDFHRPRAERHRRHDLSPWQRYYLDSFDHPAIRAALLPLGPGGDQRYRRARFDAVVLADGVFLCRPELDDLWDVRIVVAIDADESLRRGPPRDQAWVGSVETAAQRYRTAYIPGEDHYLATARPHERADVVIDNRDPASPRLLYRGRADLPILPSYQTRDCR